MDKFFTKSALHANPRRFARIAGVFYLLVFVFGIAALTTSGNVRLVTNLTATAIYYVVTMVLYQLYKPVSRVGSLATAVLSFTALTIGLLSDIGVVRAPFNTLVLFGGYCIGLGWLTVKSTFLPSTVGVLLIGAGMGWLTHIHPPLAKQLGPWALAPGMIGEGVLTVWLIAVGVNPDRWHAQASSESLAASNSG
jgi:hypothetical protein